MVNNERLHSEPAVGRVAGAELEVVEVGLSHATIRQIHRNGSDCEREIGERMKLRKEVVEVDV